MIYLFVIVFISVVGSDCQSDFFALVRKNDTTYHCITNSSYALSWIDEEVTRIHGEALAVEAGDLEVAGIPYISVIVDGASCKRSYKTNYNASSGVACIIVSVFGPNLQNTDRNVPQAIPFWDNQNSLEGNVSKLVLDRRWEEFHTFVTGNSTNQQVISQLKENFVVPFSLRTDGSANISLCGPKGFEDCYNFHLQYRNVDLTWSSFGHLENNTAKMNTIIFHPDDLPLYLTSQKWSHFLLEKNSKFLSLSKTEDLKVTTIFNTSFVKPTLITRMLVGSENGGPGFWKIHTYQYFYIEKEHTSEIGWLETIGDSFCVAMFVAMCSSCRLKLTVREGCHEDAVVVANKLFMSKPSWMEVKIFGKRGNSSGLCLFVSTVGTKTQAQFWAVASVRQCQEHEFRRITLNRKAKCQLIGSGTHDTIQFDENATQTYDCPQNTLGKYCIPCSLLFSGGCISTKICERVGSESACSTSKPESTWLDTVPQVLHISIALVLVSFLIIVGCACGSKPRQKPHSSGEIVVGDVGRICSKPVASEKFCDYVKMGIQNNDLHFQCLKVLKHTSTSSYDRVNNNLIVDDVDMCYGDGYQVPGAYLVAQVPQRNEIPVFWKQIWKHQVEHIVLLDDSSATKYWPQRNKITFDDFYIVLVSCKIFADYEHRKFILTREDQLHQVDQYRYVSWPKDGLPLSAVNLVPFIQKLSTIPLSSEYPILIQCSSDLTGTGLVLLCDMCLRSAKRDGTVDVFRNFQRLVQYSHNWVSDDAAYYIFAHLVVMECLCGVDTSVSCKDLQPNLLKGKVQRDDKYLKGTAWWDTTMTAVVRENSIYFKLIAPAKKNQVRLESYLPEMLNNSDIAKLNTVMVDGFRSPQKFTVTQQPTRTTLEAYWKLMQTANASAVILLHNTVSCSFWPDEDHPEVYPSESMTLYHQDTQSLDCGDLIKIKMMCESEANRTMDILLMKKWRIDSHRPESVPDFVKFCLKSEEILKRSSRVVVTCYDGVGASGLYLAMLYNMGKMKLEKTCDVCNAIRVVRSSNGQFMQKQEQLAFLWDAARSYLEEIGLRNEENIIRFQLPQIL